MDREMDRRINDFRKFIFMSKPYKNKIIKELDKIDEDFFLNKHNYNRPLSDLRLTFIFSINKSDLRREISSKISRSFLRLSQSRLE